MAEEIKGFTWNFDGAELEPWQAAQRLYKAGFKDAQLLATMWAVIESESGGYLKAWHHNIVRDELGNIVYDAEGNITIKSTDLGFIQKNVVHSPHVKVKTPEESQAFVEQLFIDHPDLGRGDRSAELAYSMYKARGFDPWVAYTNGNWRRNIDRGCLAVGNYLGMVFLGKPKLLQRRDG